MKSRSFRYGFTYKCASCGKEFWVADPSQWVYKMQLRLKCIAHIPVIGLGKKNRKQNGKRNAKGKGG